MNLETRKLEFIQAFLKLQSEEVISQLENLLNKSTAADKVAGPMSVEELNARIDKSENDFKNGKFKTNTQILSKYS